MPIDWSEVRRRASSYLKVCVLFVLFVLLPGPAVALANLWIEPLCRLTVFAHPDWCETANATAAALSAIVVVSGGVLYFRDRRDNRVGKWAAYSLALGCVLAIVCLIHYAVLSWGMPRTRAEILQNTWFFSYLTMVFALELLAGFIFLHFQSRT